jgi:adenine phosphoribosyltransferase
MSPWSGSFEDHVRDIPDWPRPGVVFKDITPLLADPAAFNAAIDAIAHGFEGRPIDKVLGIEARGFIFAAPVAYHFGAGFVPVRKAGKLPWKIEREEYTLEYGTDLLEIHRDAVHPGEQVLVIDDVLATGGTAAATARLIERLGGELVGFAFLIELGFLGGRRLLGGTDVMSLVSYDGAEGGAEPAVPSSMPPAPSAEIPSTPPMTSEV